MIYAWLAFIYYIRNQVALVLWYIDSEVKFIIMLSLITYHTDFVILCIAHVVDI